MQTFLVGGAVRDSLLGITPHERDWVVVGATPTQMLALGFVAVGRDFPVFLHPTTKEEYALARTERKTAPGHTGFVVHSSPEVTLEQDLQRRDLTINAIAQTADGQLVDPCGGRNDLEQRVLRHVSTAFTEDPLRVLRLARFLARFQHLGFSVAPETLALLRQMAASGELSTLVAERVWKEIERALGEPSPQAFFSLLADCGALAVLLPELADRHCAWDVLGTDEMAEGDTVTRFAAVFGQLDTEELKHCCARLKIPTGFRDLAVLVSLQRARLDAAQASSSTLLELLELTDAFRRPDRFAQWLIACRVLGSNTANIAQLQLAFTACQQLDTGAIAQKASNGPARAQCVRDARLTAIDAQLRAGKVRSSDEQ